MANVSIATFVIGLEAADNVRRQLAGVPAFLKTPTHKAGLIHLAHRFERLLSSHPTGFETSYAPTDSQPLRAIWRGHQQTAGMLYIANAQELLTINLLLSGIDRKVDTSALETLGRTLSPVDAYFESLAIVRFGARPLIATFCSRFASLARNADAVQLAFAAVFFQHCGIG